MGSIFKKPSLNPIQDNAVQRALRPMVTFLEDIEKLVGANFKKDAISGSPTIIQPGGSGAFDHGALTGLADDDHPQYVTHDEGDAAYAPLVHAPRHQSGGADSIKLDDLAAPDDNTDLNASTSKHGLLPKLGGGTDNFLRADGTWVDPTPTKTRSCFVRAIETGLMSGTVGYGMVGTFPNRIHRLSMGSTANMSCGWTWMVPRDYVAGTNIEVFAYYFPTGSTDAAEFKAEFAYLSVAAGQDPQAAENLIDNIALPKEATNTYLEITSLGTFSTGVAANEALRCRFTRDIDQEAIDNPGATIRVLNLVGFRFDYTAEN